MRPTIRMNLQIGNNVRQMPKPQQPNITRVPVGGLNTSMIGRIHTAKAGCGCGK
jgi:hypothetical protein